MWYIVEDNEALKLNFEMLKSRINSVGRWHSKRRRADATRIWKILYQLITTIVNDSPEYTHSPILEIEYMPVRKVYSMEYMHRGHICYRGYVAKEKNHDHDKTVSKLNEVLKHYNLILIEQEESKQHAETNKSINRNRLYRVIFAEKQ